MPHSFRLTRADFKGFTAKNQRRIRFEYFTLGITPLPVGSGVKFACVVSKKVSKKASERNLIKRRFREILRPLVARMQQPVALIFHITPAAVKVDFATLETSVREAVKQVS